MCGLSPATPVSCTDTLFDSTDGFPARREPLLCIFRFEPQMTPTAAVRSDHGNTQRSSDALWKPGENIMQNSEYQKYHLGGYSPGLEMRRGFESWVRRLRTIEQPNADPVTPSHELGQPQDQRGEAGARVASPYHRRPDDESWQDDGGESG